MAERTRAIAVDVMGSEAGISICVKGALDYLSEMTEPMRVILVGDEGDLRAELQRHYAKHPRRDLVEIVHAADLVDMRSPATDGIRKKDSSIAVAVRLQQEGRVQATVSPGHTGAFMAAALFTLGRMKSVSRPAIATYFPTESGSTLILDVGANPTCKSQNLYEFAVMGSVYSSLVMRRSSPRVALLSIGEEKSKGNELTLATHEMLSRAPLNFIGNIEGRDILKGRADVIVCDGFIGNIMLKFAESIQGFVITAFRRQIESNWFSRVGAFLMGPFLRRLRRTFDYAEVGGAPLLGVRGICIVGHGQSSSRAIYNAIDLASRMIDSEVNKHINNALTDGDQSPAERS